MSQRPGPTASVVVVTHEARHEVGDCLRALLHHPPRQVREVLVVDNASRDGTADWVASTFPAVTVVRAPHRRGFAANCNAGAARATGSVLVFLNPDARPRPGAVDRLVGFVARHPEVAVAGARLVYPDGSAQPSARRFPSPSATLIRRTPLRLVMGDSAAERRHLMVGEDLSRPRTVDWVLGAAIAVPTRAFWALGGMDEGYRLYCEDIDLCWRAWSAGWQVAYVPDAVIEHDLGELTRHRFLTRRTVWHVRGMGRFVRHHGLVGSGGAPTADHRELEPVSTGV